MSEYPHCELVLTGLKGNKAHARAYQPWLYPQLWAVSGRPFMPPVIDREGESAAVIRKPGDLPAARVAHLVAGKSLGCGNPG